LTEGTLKNVPSIVNKVNSSLPLGTREQEILRIAKIGRSNELQLDMKVVAITTDTRRRLTPRTLLDSGCTKSSIDAGFAKKMGIHTKPVHNPTPVRNADGSINGWVKTYAELEIEFVDAEGFSHREIIEFPIVNLGGKHDVFIGYDWLKYHNPLIDWKTGEISMLRCPEQCRSTNTKSVVWDNSPTDISYLRTIATEIAIKAHEEKEVQLPEQYSNFSDVFEKKEFDKLPERKPWDHAINLQPGADKDRKLKGKVYPMNAREQKALDEFLEENLRTGRIRPSQSPIAAPFFFVKKKDGTLRPVQDYRRVNAVTIKDSWPLPLISDVITKIKDAKYFSKFDVRWGFNNVRIKEGDEWKAAFITNRGLHEPTVMFFGLTNSPATFQHMMDDIFVDMIRSNQVIVYMDDILVFSKDLETHRTTVKEVLKRLRQHRLYLKLEKCKFEQEEVEFLGIVVRNGQISMDPTKTKAVKEWPIPANMKEARSFMQFCNFYRAFIPNFSDITVPLNELTKKGVKFEWTPERDNAVQQLKDAVARNATLLLPIDGAKFRLETDASDYAAGAVLHQIIDGTPRPVAFFSKTFGPAERNYQIYDKEMLAIMLALDHWRHFLRNGEEFDIWSDHQNLQYFREPQKLNRRQARWYTELADYNFKIHHRPGKLNIVADTLSRKDQPEGGVKTDNIDITMLDDDKVIAARAITMIDNQYFDNDRLSFRDEEEILDEVRRRRQQCDDKVATAMTAKNKDYQESNGIIKYRGLVYIPRDRTLRERILYAHHDTPIAGHPGRHKTVELIQRNYWWPGLSGHVARYVRACETCQRTKPRQGPIATELYPHSSPEEPWSHIAADLIAPLPDSQGYDAILTVVDKLTKMVIAIPTNTNLTAEGTARQFRDHVFKRFGIPKKVTSDRGPQFVSNFMKEFYKMIGVEGNPSTAYHPQTNGQTERTNAELEKYLRQWVNDRQDDWAEWLAIAEFALNNRVVEATGVTPFQLNYGRHPNMNINPSKSSRSESASEFATRMKNAWEEARSALTIAAEQMKRQSDRHRRESPAHQEGDLVWLETTNLKLPKAPDAMKKLQDRRVGPFKILQKIGRSAYKLQLPPGWTNISNVFNENLLTPYTPPEASHQTRPAPPPPEMVDGSERFEVEEILDSRRRGKGIQYLVKWKGYPPEENTWEPPSNLAEGAEEAQADFHRKFPDRPRVPAQGKARTPKRVRHVSIPGHEIPEGYGVPTNKTDPEKPWDIKGSGIGSRQPPEPLSPTTSSSPSSECLATNPTANAATAAVASRTSPLASTMPRCEPTQSHSSEMVSSSSPRLGMITPKPLPPPSTTGPQAPLSSKAAYSSPSQRQPRQRPCKPRPLNRQPQ
jgi:transposase InsO family protein